MQKCVTQLWNYTSLLYITVIHKGFYVCYLVISSSVLASLKVQPEPLCKDDLSFAALWNSSRPNGRETHLHCSPRRTRTQHTTHMQLHPAQHTLFHTFTCSHSSLWFWHFLRQQLAVPLIMCDLWGVIESMREDVWSDSLSLEHKSLKCTTWERLKERERGYTRTVSPLHVGVYESRSVNFSLLLQAP